VLPCFIAGIFDDNRNVAAVIPPVAKTSPGARETEKEKDQQRNQTSQCDVLDHRIPSGHGAGRILRGWRNISLLRTPSAGESCTAVRTELCVIGIGQSAIWAIHMNTLFRDGGLPMSVSPVMSLLFQLRVLHSSNGIEIRCPLFTRQCESSDSRFGCCSLCIQTLLRLSNQSHSLITLT
jgi:hypothetical protein